MPDTGKQSHHTKAALKKQLLAVGMGLLLWGLYHFSGQAGTDTLLGQAWLGAMLLFIYALLVPMIEANLNNESEF